MKQQHLRIIAAASFVIATCVFALAAGVAPVTPTRAEDILSLQDSCMGTSAGQVPVKSSTWKAQTFAPTVGYSISFVDLPGTNVGGTTTLHIQQTVGAKPSGADLASVSITSGSTFFLPAPLPLSQGALYALVLSNEGGSYNWSFSGSSTCYANVIGQPLTSQDSGTSWSGDSVDFNFAIYDSTSTLRPTATPTPRPPGQALLSPTVFVIAFPFSTPTNDPQRLTDTIIDRLEDGSAYHGYSDTAARPYFRFQIYGGAIVNAAELPPQLTNGAYDFSWIYEQYDLCALAQSGAIDEVWIWDGGQGGMPEWAVAGPEWAQTGGYNLPNCGKQLTTMVFNYNRDVGPALHSFNHRLEGMAMHYFPCDFYTETWPWVGWPLQCAGLVSDQYGFVARPSANNGYVAGCGDVHHPPNISDASQYVYDSAASVQSICEDWGEDGSAIASTISCQTWGCTEVGYQVWWMQNYPGYKNTNRDRSGKLLENWLAYLFGTPTEQPTATPTVTLPPAPTATPTATVAPAPTATPTATVAPAPTATPTAAVAPAPTATPTAADHRVMLPLVISTPR